MGRHIGNNNARAEERNEELYKCYREALKSMMDKRGFVCATDAIEIARSSPCSCYYVGYDRAYAILFALEKYYSWTRTKKTPNRPKHPLYNVRDTSRSMFFDLYKVYEQIRLENPDESRMSSVIKACSTPAKQFYITFGSARIILQRMTTSAKKSRSNKNFD